MLYEIKSLDLPLDSIPVPQMIALLAGIQDQLGADRATSDLAEDLAPVIAALLTRREQALEAMLEADATRCRERPAQVTAKPAALC